MCMRACIQHILSICIFICVASITYGQFSQKITVNTQRKVILESPDNFMTIEIFNNQNDSAQLITNYNIIETDNEITCNIADYNFDGNKDFSISYTVSNTTVFHIFVFNIHTNEFNRVEFPNNTKAICDCFSNITLNTQKKHVISSCKNDDNDTFIDVWIFTKDGLVEYVGKKK